LLESGTFYFALILNVSSSAACLCVIGRFFALIRHCDKLARRPMLQFTLVGGVFGLLLAIAPVFAHHSTAPYDLVHGTILDGVVADFVWENPHAHILLDVTGDDALEHWTVELESPNLLRRLGWDKDTLKTGDRILITGGRAKNGSFSLRAVLVQTLDGRKLQALPPPEN
jgi:Family of unknown function (DUF6152)